MHAVERNTIRWVSQDAEGVALFELDLPVGDALELALGRRIAGYYGEPRRIPAQAGDPQPAGRGRRRIGRAGPDRGPGLPPLADRGARPSEPRRRPRPGRAGRLAG